MIRNDNEKQQTEEARWRLAAIVESSDDAIVSKDLNGVIVTWNKGAERLFGYSAQEIVGKPVTILIPDGRQDEESGILRQIRAGERIDHYDTVRTRKDGSLVDISLTVSPIKDDKGNVIGASKIARNISERKRAEAQRNLLVAELNHRVKNTLATVLSIARQSFANRDVEEGTAAFGARLRALAQAHSRLAETNWSGASLQTILQDELEPYRDNDGSNVRTAGTPLVLSPKFALALSMAIHELATNAAKHGALSTAAGAVDINWILDPADKTLRLSWREEGGPTVATPQRNGFGRLFLERVLPSDLHSHIPWTSHQGRCGAQLPYRRSNMRSAVDGYTDQPSDEGQTIHGKSEQAAGARRRR